MGVHGLVPGLEPDAGGSRYSAVFDVSPQSVMDEARTQCDPLFLGGVPCGPQLGALLFGQAADSIH